jgi:hypothetical protein
MTLVLLCGSPFGPEIVGEQPVYFGVVVHIHDQDHADSRGRCLIGPPGDVLRSGVAGRGDDPGSRVVEHSLVALVGGEAREQGFPATGLSCGVEVLE